MKWVNRLYILFLGIILSITTGFGVAAFYPQPLNPVYPTSSYMSPVLQSCEATPESQESDDCQKILKEQRQSQIQDDQNRRSFDDAVKRYQNDNASYTRTAIFFGIVIGALYAIIGLGILKKSKLMSTALLLSGVLTAVLTRLLIGLASLGSGINGTAQPDSLAFVEFGILLLLSIAIAVVGFLNLRDDTHN